MKLDGEIGSGQIVKVRADARRNREVILDSADDVLAAEGGDVSLDRIVRALPVGKSTFFRHFADRETLLAALLDRALADLARNAAVHAGKPDALFTLLEYLAGTIGRKVGLVDYWMSGSRQHPATAEAERRICDALAEPVRRAVEAGLCRADLTARDIMIWAQMLGGGLRGCSPKERAARAARANRLFREGIVRCSAG